MITNTQRSISRSTFLLATLILLTGCVNYRAYYHAPLTGEIASDLESHRIKGTYHMPANAPSISQGYHPAPDIWDPGEAPKDHPGLDIVAKPGTPVLAAASGVVTSSFYEPFFGNQIAIQHAQQLPQGIVKTKYLHLQERSVEVGDELEAGEQIGTLGRSGALAAFPHLHFEVRYRGEDKWIPVNPHRLWLDGPGQISCYRKTGTSDRFLISYPVPCEE